MITNRRRRTWPSSSGVCREHLLQRPGQALVLIAPVVELGRDPNQAPGWRRPPHHKHLDPMLSEQLLGERVAVEPGSAGPCVRGRQRHCGERADHLLRAGRRHVERLAQQRPRLKNEGPVVVANRRPAAIEERADKSNRLRYAQEWCWVVSPDPVELEPEARPAARIGVGAVACHERPDTVAVVRIDVEKRRSLWRAQPLVAIARVVSGTQCAEVELELADGMSAVNQELDAALATGLG